MKLTVQIIYQVNTEKKVQNGELNGHAVPAPETEPGMYTIYCTVIFFMRLNASPLVISSTRVRLYNISIIKVTSRLLHCLD